MLFKANQMPPVLGGNPLSGGPPMPPQVMPMPNSMTGGPPMPVPGPNFNPMPMPGQDIDLRAIGNDPRIPGGVPAPVPPAGIDPRQIDPRMPRNLDQDMRSLPNPVPPPIMDPRSQRPMQPQPPQPVVAPVPFPSDPRQRQSDPRLRGAGGGVPPVGPTPQQQSAQQQLQNRLATNYGIPSDASDQEKAALIMQVLQLSDEQISQLPPEQRASILVLKEQIAKSTQR